MKPSRTNPLFARFFRGNNLVAAVVLTLGAASLPSATAQSISVKFGANQAGSTITEATKTAGAVAVAGNRWNNTTVNGGGTLGSLIDSTGAITAGSVTWTAQNTWESGSGGATATSENGDLTKGYLDDSGTGWTVNLKSPYLFNDVYIIHATDQGNPATMSAVSVNGVFYKGNGAGGTVLATGVGDSWSAANFTNADILIESTNFIKALNQPTVSLAGFSASPGRAAIGGVQVVNAYTGTLSYWDTDGATAGAGGATPAGTWDAATTNWSASSLGDVATGAWTASNAAVFSAGSASTGAFAVQVAGTVTADAVWAKDGTVTLADGGSGLVTLAGSALLRGDTGLVVNAPISAPVFNTSGNVTLGSAANSIGLATISGTTTLATAQSFGRLAGGGTVAIGTNALTVGGDNADSTFQGQFTGSGAISKTGTGRLSIGSNITGYTGTLTANAGVLRIGTGGASGSLSGTVAVNGTVELLRSDASTIPTIFTGAGALNLLGTGVSGQSDYTLGGATSGFTGAVSIDDSRLRMNPANLDNCASITVVSGGQAWLFAGNHKESYIINGDGWLEPTGYLGAFRFENNANLTGSVNVASASRMVGWGTTGTVSGTLTGSAALSLNLAGNPGTLNFTGTTVGYTGAMTLNAGTLNIGASGLGGSLSVAAGTARVTGGIATDLTVSGGTATSTGTTVTANGATVTVGGTIGGNVTVNGGTASADGATAIATAGGAAVILNGNVTGNLVLKAGSATVLNGGKATAAGGTATVNASVTGSISVADGAILAGEGSAGTLNLGSTTGSTLRVNASTSGALTAGNVNLVGTNTVQLTHTPTVDGPFVVLAYTGTLSGDETNFLVPTGTYRGDPEVQHDSGAKQFTLLLEAQTRTWDNGAGTANWNTTDLNWAGGDETFFAGDPVIFTDTAATTVNLATGLQPMSITLQNTAGNNYIFTGGSIVGSTGLSMAGGGNLTLGGANTFTGVVNVGAGVLTMGSAGAFGVSSGITVANGATVDISGQSPGTVATGGYTYTIQGTGADNSGAIRNTGGGVASNAGVKSLVLAGNATVNAVGRFDIGSANVAGFGTITGNGNTLTKIGAGGIAMRGDASATGITYVVEAGDIWAEDNDGALGGATGSVTANGTARVGTYGTRTIATPVTLNAGTSLMNLGGGNGIWTGAINATGPITVNAGGNMAIDGTLTGTNNITKTGGSVLVLQSDSSGYSGKLTVNAGTLRLENSAALGTATGADVITLVGGASLQGGTIAATASATVDATRGITHSGTGIVYYNAGGAANTLTINSNVVGGVTNLATQDGIIAFSGAVTLSDPANIAADLVARNNSTVSFLSGANVNVRQIRLGENGQGNNSHMSIAPGATITTTRLVSSDGANIASNINQAGGTLTITGNNSSNSTSASFLLGHWNGTTTYNLSGGTLNSIAAMLSLGWDAGTLPGVIFNQSGGTANLAGVNLGNSRNNTAAYNLTGGRLNLGGSGITDATNKAFNLGGGTVGAFASWIGSKPITLTGINGNATFDTLDSVDGVTPRTVTLTGALANTAGAGFTKTGAGVLALNSAAAGTFNGTATVNGGSLMLNASSLAAGTVKVDAGGAIQVGTIAAPGTGNVANLTLDGGTANIRVGTTADLINVTGTFAVNSPSTIRALPASAITTLPAKFTVLDYTGTIGGLGADGLDLNTELIYASGNPHLVGNLSHDEANTRLDVTITAADTVVWKGDGDANGDWDVSSSNWVLGSDSVTPTRYYDFDVVTLNDIGFFAPNINLVGTITPASVAVSNSIGTYVLTGSGIGGSGPLTKSGVGGLTLLNDNTYGGATSITAGTVTVGNGGTVGTLGGAGPVTLSNATLIFNRSDAQTVNRAFTGANGWLIKEGTGVLTITGAPPALTGVGAIFVNAGTLIMGTNDYAAVGAPGGLTVSNSAVLRINAINSLSNAATTVTANTGAVIELNAYHSHFNRLTLNGATVTGIGNGAAKYNAEDTTFDNVVTVGGSAMSELRSSTGGRYGLYGGSFNVGEAVAGTDLLISGSLIGNALTKTGAGTMTLTGNNTYTAGTNLEAGTLEAASVADAGGVGSIGTSYLGINNGSTFRYTGTTAETTARLLWIDRGTQTNTIDIVNAGGAITFTGVDGVRNKPFSKTGLGALTINGPITPGAAITVAGGTLTLAGANTYAGPTKVNDTAKLSVNGGAIGDTGVLYIAAAGMVEVTTGTELVSELIIDGVSQAVGTYGTTASGAAFPDDVHFSGPGVVSVTGAKFESWITKFGLAFADQTATADPDADSLNNLLEWVLGGNPSLSDAASILPTRSVSGDNLVLSFKRTDQSEVDTTVKGQWSTDLLTWTDVAPTLVNENGAAADDMTVSVPLANAVDGKLFLRLGATK